VKVGADGLDRGGVNGCAIKGLRDPLNPNATDDLGLYVLTYVHESLKETEHMPTLLIGFAGYLPKLGTLNFGKYSA
jgi:hypothetical protein